MDFSFCSPPNSKKNIFAHAKTAMLWYHRDLISVKRFFHRTWIVVEQSLVIWWRYQMEAFSALLDLCAGNSLVTSEFPSQRPVTRSFDVFFDLRLNKRLSKHSRRQWFETPPRLLWRHCSVYGPQGLISLTVLDRNSHSTQISLCLIQNRMKRSVHCFAHGSGTPVVDANIHNKLIPGKGMATKFIFVKFELRRKNY